MSLRFDRLSLRFSPQEIDPISWITGSMLPIAFGGLALVAGTAGTVATWGASDRPWLQLVAVLLCVAACASIHVLTRPLRPPLRWRGAVGAMLLAVCGFLLSATGYAGVPIAIELWWAPIAVGLALASLAPSLPARGIAVLGAGTLAATVPVGAVLVSGDGDWGPVSTVLIIASPILSAIVGTVTFSTAVVGRLLPLLESRTRSSLALDPPRGEENEQAERERLAILTARAVPFIERIARSGRVSAADRTLAGQLARRLRDDLVTASTVSWLDAAADERVVVVDPDRRADRMRSAQRTALRALIRAILELPGADARTLLVELRDAGDGSTAVGVSLDADLPEGRRSLHLAPSYLALRGSVDDLRLLDRDRLRLTFNLPPQP